MNKKQEKEIGGVKKKLGIFIFDDVEVLDFCGPLEVFGSANKEMDEGALEIFTFSESVENIDASSPLTVKPDYDLDHVPAMDYMVIPGGIGTRSLLDNDDLIEWLADAGPKTELLMSVCTGSLLLAEAGLLDGKEATTHHEAIDQLKELGPHIDVREDQRIVDNGDIICSAVISSGIDMSLHVVEKLFGEEVAKRTKKRMEYPDRKASA
jgi:transcriptional regulator GlxA family with amidase domain